MSYTGLYQWGPGLTPKVIRYLILWTSLITLISALMQSLFYQFSISIGPQEFLGLSWWGLKRWFLWQPITFLFIQTTSSYGISFFFLLTLIFNMYILWVMGSAVVDIVGTKSFLYLYFLSGIVAGLVSLLLMPVIGQYGMLAGPFPAILAVIMVWTMFHPDLEILLFFLIPIKAKWLIAAIIGAILLVTISQWNFIDLIFYCTGIIFGYLYAVIAWEARSPFSFTHPFERWLTHWSLYLKQSLPKRKQTEKAPPKQKEKIVAIKTGKTIDDEAFVDAMLTKISKFGEKSLSWTERRRMQEISDRKMKEKQSGKH
jgi:membrane associated rhomboid family serine protease